MIPLLSKEELEQIEVEWYDVITDLQIETGDCPDLAVVIAKAQLKKVVEWLEEQGLFIGDRPPIEGENYVYLGDYILKYGHNTEPQAGFRRLSDSPEFESLKAELK